MKLPSLITYANSAVLTYTSQQVEPHLLMRGDFTPRVHSNTIRVSRRKNGSIRVAHNGKSLNRMSYTSYIGALSDEALTLFHKALDHCGVPRLPHSHVQEAIDASLSAEESLHRAKQNGVLESAAHGVLRTFKADQPIFSALVPDLLNDCFYDDAETVTTTENSLLNATTVREFTHKAFGAYRKDIVRLVMQSAPETVIWLSWFGEHLTPDQHVRAMTHFLENPPEFGLFSLLEEEFIREMLNDVTHPTSRYNLATMKHAMEWYENHMLSTIWVSDSQAYSGKFNGWEALYKTAQRVTGDALKGIQAHTPVEFLGVKSDESMLDTGYSPYILTTAEDYLTTGSEMGVCIGQLSYMRDAERGDNVHIRFHDHNDSMFALLDLKKNSPQEYKVIEFRGRKNTNLDQEISDLLLTSLSQETGLALV